MIDSEGNNDEIVRAIINLARTLGLKVVAEGVETEEQRDLLTRLECEGGQGFLFAKPMQFAELKTFLSANGNPGVTSPQFDDISTISLVH